MIGKGDESFVRREELEAEDDDVGTWEDEGGETAGNGEGVGKGMETGAEKSAGEGDVIREIFEGLSTAAGAGTAT